MLKQRHTLNLARLRFLAGLAGCFFLLISGCVTTEQLAPRVDGAMLSLTARDGLSLDQATRGRQIYITNCTKCHSPEPVTRYTQTQWNEILPRMAEETNLTSEQTADVKAYVELILVQALNNKSN